MEEPLTNRTAPAEKTEGKWKFGDLLRDAQVRDRWEKVRKYFFLRESTYDITNRCNIRCDGCYYYEGEKQFAPENRDPGAWRERMQKEKERGITYVVLAGAEPSLVPELLETCFEVMPLGSIPPTDSGSFPRHRYKIHISVWGNDETSRRVRMPPTSWSGSSTITTGIPGRLRLHSRDRISGKSAKFGTDRRPERKLTFNVFSAPVGYEGPPPA
jgi:hypothetical protein